MQLELNDKAVIVTGANGGIGSVIVQAFLAEGAQVLGTDIEPARSPDAASAWCEADISTRAGAEAIVSEAVRSFGGIDVVVNCAGISEPAALESTAEESWQRVIDVNLTAPWRLSQAAMPLLKERSGNIVNISSFAGKRATLFGDNASYTASKAGIIGLTHALALECASSKVRVNSVAPAPADTPMLQALPEDKREQLVDMIPLGALPTPAAIADAVIFLASERASFITGEILDVNGGLYLD